MRTNKQKQISYSLLGVLLALLFVSACGSEETVSPAVCILVGICVANSGAGDYENN